MPILHGWTVTYYMYFYLRLYMASNRLLFQPFFQLAIFFRQMYHRTGFEVALDYNTYVWIAQLMILGLSVGYLRDQLSSMKLTKRMRLPIK